MKLDQSACLIFGAYSAAKLNRRLTETDVKVKMIYIYPYAQIKQESARRNGTFTS